MNKREMRAVNEAKVSASRLKELLSYNPDTGEIVWRVSFGIGFRARKPGDVAGSVQKRYRAIWVDGVRFSAHRIAWAIYYGAWPDGDLDHINGAPLDNRINNLRVCAHGQNMHNTRTPRNNTSGFKGVSVDKRDGRWTGELRCARIKYSTRRYATAAEASAELKIIRERLHQEFANHG